MTDTKFLKEFPFCDISTSELISIFSLSLTENLEDNSFYQHIKSISDTMLLQNFYFSYVTTEAFSKADYRSDSNIETSHLHLNIQSLNQNYMALYHLLDLVIMSLILSCYLRLVM